MKPELDQRIICTENLCYEDEITIGKTYIVRWHSPNSVVILNDHNDARHFPKACFEPLMEAPMETPTAVPTIIENEHIYMFDVDDTLVMWSDDFSDPGPDRVKVIDPYDGSTVYLTPHIRHIKLLMQMNGRGRHIIVWSQGGVKWAQAVVDALKLEHFVHTIMTKPHGYVDDLPASEWLSNHIYIGDKK